MTPQQKSDKYERRLGAMSSIGHETVPDINDLAVETGLSQAARDEIAAKGQALLDAQQDYCDTLHAHASAAGITTQSSPGPKKQN